MGVFAILVLVAILAVAGYVISTYNYFQTAKTRIVASVQEIGNQLKRQASLIPNLSESAKAYIAHEKDIFDKLTDARKAVEAASKEGGRKIDEAVDKITELLPRLNVIVESNPQLKADAVVTRLMDELRDTSDKLMYSRRTLIDLSADYNARRITFPSNLVANAFGFKEEKGLAVPVEGAHLEISPAETQDVKVDLQ